MRFKLPASTIFKCLDQKVIAALSNLALKCGWDQPHRGFRVYKASALTRAYLLYYLQQMKSLDDLHGYLAFNPTARKLCGFMDLVPSRSTFSRFRRTVGSAYFETLFSNLLKILKDKGLLQGRILAINSTFFKARSSRKGEVKPDFLLGKSCDFARVGRTRNGFQLGYRLQLGVVSRYEIPVAAEVFPGNHSDYHGIEPVVRRMEPFVKPAVITADGGYFSQYHCQLLAKLPAMCLVRSAKTSPKTKHKKGPKLKLHRVPANDPSHRLKEGSSAFRRVYKDRMSVERVFGRLKEHFMLAQPRVRGEDEIRQHVFLSLCVMLMVTLTNYTLGNSPKLCSRYRL